MKMCGVCLITKDVLRLSAFYKEVLETEPKGDEHHVSFDDRNLALWHPGDREESKNMILMFYVDDVTKEFERIKGLNIHILTEPETKPWGVKVFTFKDPDGHSIHFLEKL